MPAPGDTFGEFELVRELGRGAVGTVWEARQPSLDRTVAIKILTNVQTADETWVARFKSEAGEAAKLSHPGILPIHAIGETDGQHWFAMEVVQGDDLAIELAKKRRFAPREAASIVRDAARALHHAHESGVIHRDVKPANVMVRNDGRVVVTDFGLAKKLESGALTATGLLVGTPFYMSPEAIEGAAGASPSIDVYGLGVMLYELVTGKRPYEGENTIALIRAITNGKVAPPSKLAPDLPTPLERIILKAMHREPSRRHASAAALADELDDFLQPVPAGNAKGSRKLALIVGAIGIALLGGGGYLAVSLLSEKEEELSAKEDALDVLAKKIDELIGEGKLEEAEAQITELEKAGGDAAFRSRFRNRSFGAFVSNWIGRITGTKPKLPKPAELESWGERTAARVSLRVEPAGATVKLLRAPDGKGYEPTESSFQDHALPPGVYRVLAKASGYHDTILNAAVPPGARAGLEIRMPKIEAGEGTQIYFAGFWAPGADGNVTRQLDPYFLDRALVTNGEYATFVRDRSAGRRPPANLMPEAWRRGGAPRNAPDAPVLVLTEAMARAYATSVASRLPTEGEIQNAFLTIGLAPWSPVEGGFEAMRAHVMGILSEEGFSDSDRVSIWYTAPDGRATPLQVKMNADQPGGRGARGARPRPSRRDEAGLRLARDG